MRIRFLCSLCLSLVAVFLLEASPGHFDFSSFLHLKAGETFTVFEAKGRETGKQLGEGLVRVLTETELAVEMEMNPPFPRGSFHLKYEGLDLERKEYRVLYSFRMERNGIEETKKGTGTVPDYLVESGFLSLHEEGKNSFLQLSRKGAKQSILLSDAWRVILVSP